MFTIDKNHEKPFIRNDFKTFADVKCKTNENYKFISMEENCKNNSQFESDLNRIASELKKAKRRKYYERERLKRYKLADERRAILVRRTINKCPTLDEIREAWRIEQETKDVPRLGWRNPKRLARLYLGALLEDLECYVDNHAYVKRGVAGISGRAPGIKGLFKSQAPDLFRVYKIIMKRKSLAKRYRQACGCKAPVPIQELLPCDSNAYGATTNSLLHSNATNSGSVSFRNNTVLRSVQELTNWMKSNGNTEYLRSQAWVSDAEGRYSDVNLLKENNFRIARWIQNFKGGSQLALEAAIAILIDPDCVVENVIDCSTTAIDDEIVQRMPVRIQKLLKKCVA